MQTFLPYPSFLKSVKALDYRRLGKQRVEAKQILAALAGTSKGWRNHPCCDMWRGYETALKLYHDLCITEWMRRGYKNTMPYLYEGGFHEQPPWVGDKDFHASHRANLLRKDPVFYSQYGWVEDPNLPYIWPKSDRIINEHMVG